MYVVCVCVCSSNEFCSSGNFLVSVSIKSLKNNSDDMNKENRKPQEKQWGSWADVCL